MTISEMFSSSFLAIRYRLAQKREKRSSAARAPGGGRLFRQLLAVALPISASALAGNLISAANTVLVPQRLMAAGMPQGEAVGVLGVLFGMALPLFMLPMAFVGPLVMVMLPRLSEGCALGDMKSVHRKMGKALFATGLIALPAVSVMTPIGPAVCQLLYGQVLPQSYFLWLAGSMVFVYYQAVTSGMLNAIGLQSRAMASNITGGMVQLAFTWFAVADPAFGIYGFMAGMLASSALSAILNIFWLMEKTKFKMQWARWIALPALSAAASGLAAYNVYLFMGNLGWNNLSAMVLAVSVGIGVNMLALKIQGLKIGRYLGPLLPVDRFKEQAFRIGGYFF